MKHAIFFIGLCATIVSSSAWAQTLQPSTDRRSPGDQAIVLRGVLATPGTCLKQCRDQSTCFRWTFVRNAVDGAPNCFVGSAPQDPRTDGCCTSGRVR